MDPKWVGPPNMSAIVSDSGVFDALRVLVTHENPSALLGAARLLKQILTNVQHHPEDTVYHHLKMTARAIQERLMPVPGTIDLLKAMGFHDAGDGEHLELPTMTEGDRARFNVVIGILDETIDMIVHPFEGHQDPIRELDFDIGIIKKHRPKDDIHVHQQEIGDKFEAAKRERRLEDEAAKQERQRHAM